MEKVRINNDLLVKYTVFRDGQPESFVGATDITVTVTNEAYKKAISNTFDIVGNIVNISIDAADFNLCGKYRVTLKYVRGNDIEIDALAFEGVPYTSLTGGTEIVGVEVVTVNISGDIGIAIPDNNKIDLDGLNSDIQRLQFDTVNPVAGAQAGQVYWSDEEKTLVLNDGYHTHPIGKELGPLVKNNSGQTILNGQACSVIGSTGDNPTIGLASTANGDVAQKTIGLATMDIPNNGFGIVTTFGEVNEVNTSTLTQGSLVYLGLNGALTTAEPVAPTPKIIVGICVRQHATVGKIFVATRPIPRLSKLSDVYTTTMANGDVLRWNSTTSRFEVFNLTTALDGKVNSTGNETIAGIKTFASSPIVPTPTSDMQASTKKYADDLNATAVHKTGAETIDGVKTFNASPIIPAPTTNLQPATKKYVDDADTQLRADLNILNNVNTLYPSVPVYNRVITDTGSVRSKKTLNSLTQFLLDLRENTKLLFCPELGAKLRASGVNNYITKLYDISPMLNDGSQTTALNQPYLSGNVAPNEKYAIKNPNGGNTYITHTPISFSATDKWSVSTMLNDFCSSLADYGAYCGNGTTASNIYLRKSSANRLRFLSNSSVEYLFNVNNSLIGKNSLITFVSFGNGTLNLYLNGKLFQTISSTDTSFIFSRILNSYSTLGLNGDVKYHSIRDIALSPTQVQDEYNYLRTLFTEIESVQIGAQTWATSNCEMTCTPQGNVIQEIQAATNVEKVVNGGFDSDTGWVKTTGVSISSGALNFSGALAAQNANQNVGARVGSYYKVTYTILSRTQGSFVVNVGGGSIGQYRASIGTYTDYIKCAGPSPNVFLDSVSSFVGSIDNVSIQEVGWSDSTNLYNYVYANTTGTAEQKEYAAVKAAAMWCYYNNDPALGAIYGKLYNWYALKLLQMDIDYYNAANPTNTWGWRVPVKTDFDALSTYLGGASVAGGKMKKDGLNYWSTPNLGADNTSGLSLIGSGFRQITTGNFIYSTSRSYLYSLDKAYLSTYGYSVFSGSQSFDYAAGSQSSQESCGMSLRLIKS